ncbi:unnamed protein product [Closterium sp. Yama58-4]|nr:unnamed protein product [Closterium sp. Yama58-4]
MGGIGSTVIAGTAVAAGSAGAGVWSGRGTDGANAVQGGGAGMEHGELDAAAIERMLQLSEALLGPEDPPPHGPHIPHGHRDPHPHGPHIPHGHRDPHPHGPHIPHGHRDPPPNGPHIPHGHRDPPPHGANAPRGRVVSHASNAAALEEASALLAYGDYQRLTAGLPDAMPSSEPIVVPSSLHVSLPGSVPHAAAAAAVAACEAVCGLAGLVPPVSPSPLCMGGELTVPGSHCMLPPAVCMAPCEPASSAVNALTIDVARDDQQPCFEELLFTMSRLW